MRLVLLQSRSEALVLDGRTGEGRRGRWQEWWSGAAAVGTE
jgi:hypothetical protein